VRAGPGGTLLATVRGRLAIRSSLINESAGRRALESTAEAQVEEHVSTDRRGLHGGGIRLRIRAFAAAGGAFVFRCSDWAAPVAVFPRVPDSADRGPDNAI